MKSYLQILLVFLLFSCSTIREIKFEYLKSEYFFEYQICEDFMNNRFNIDSLANDSTILDISFLRRSNKLQELKNLDVYMYTQDYILIDINEYIVGNYSYGIPPLNRKHLDIAFTIFNKANVICFSFIERNNEYKLFSIRENPGRYYMHRRPKIDKPTGHGAHYNY